MFYFAFAIFLTTLINSAKSEEKEYQLNQEIFVTGQRAAYSSGNSLISIEVIDSKEINKLGVQSISDILEISSGLDVRNRGKSGMQSDISIRGGSFNQTMIMVDGIPINDPQTGHHNMNLTITPDMIDRIEIVKSGSSKSTGVNSFAGVINIITKKVNDNKLNLNLEGGDFNYNNVELSIQNKYGDFANLLSISRNASDGFTKNTDHTNINLALKSNYALSEINYINLNLSYADRQFGAFNFYTPSYPNQFEQTKTINASLQGKFSELLNFTPSVFYRMNYDRFELFRDFKNAPSWYSDHNYHLTSIIGTNGNINYKSVIGISSFGYEFRNENINSTVLGLTLATAINNPFDNTKFTKSKSRLNSTLFIENQYTSESFLFNLGTSIFNNSDYGTYLSPGLDLGYLIGNSKIYANYNRSVRIPTFTELYYNGPTNIGNPDLKAEISDNFELGYHLSLDNFKFEINGFLRNGKNLIDWNRDNDSTIWKTNNLTNISCYGAETSLSIDNIINHKNFVLSKTKLSVLFLQSDKKQSNVDSYYVLDHLNYKMNLLLNFVIFKDFNLTYDISYQKRNGNFQLFTSSGFVLTDYKAIILSNVKLNYNLQNLDLYINITNLFNEKYFDIANVPLAGRWASLGINYKLDY